MLVLAGCSEPFGPADVAGTYVMKIAGSASLPLAMTLPDGAVTVLEADTVVLRPDGTGRRHIVGRYTEPNGTEHPGNGPVEFTYRMVGSTLRAVIDNGPDLLLETFELRRIGDGFVELSNGGWGVTLRFDPIAAGGT